MYYIYLLLFCLKHVFDKGTKKASRGLKSKFNHYLQHKIMWLSIRTINFRDPWMNHAIILKAFLFKILLGSNCAALFRQKVSCPFVWKSFQCDVCGKALWKNYALWKVFSKCVKFGTKSTHFEIFFQSALNLGRT